MCPESISAYLKNEEIERCLFGINGCPIPVIVECENGKEFPVSKAYRVGGRAAAIKILISGEGKTNDLLNKIEELENEIENYEKEENGLKAVLAKWEDAFGNDPDSFATIWDEIEIAIQKFAKVANFIHGTNDGINIDILCAKYEDLLNEREESSKIIESLKIDNRSLCSTIETQDKTIAQLEKLLKDQKQLDKPAK